MHEGIAFRHGERGDGDEHQDETFGGAVQDFVQLVEALFGIELGEDRKRRDADGLSDDPERDRA